MRMTVRLLCLLVPLALASVAPAQATRPAMTPVKVEVVRDGDGWAMLRDGEPYVVRGAGGEADLALLALIGGNSIRTWDATDGTAAVLDDAHANGMTVAVGLWLKHKSAGADYADADFRAAQLAAARGKVLAHKDHPAVLIWGVGNESEVGSNTPDYWRHVNDVAAMIQEVDPNHPTMTVTAEIGDDMASKLREFCPAVDVWGINSYKGLFTLDRRLTRQGYDGPTLITEFGGSGMWEVDKTDYGAAVEQTSTQKAAQFSAFYAQQIGADSRCLGSYAFLWRRGPDPSATWYPILSDRGETGPIADAMHRAFTGHWPDDRAPDILAITSDAFGGVLQAGSRHDAAVEAFDPEGAELIYEWAVYNDRHSRKPTDPPQAAPEDLEGLVSDADRAACRFTAPDLPGRYRLYVHVRDPAGRVGVANVPFRVDPPTTFE